MPPPCQAGILWGHSGFENCVWVLCIRIAIPPAGCAENLTAVTGPKKPTRWTGPREIKRQAEQLWARGLVAADLASDNRLFPKRLVLRGPNSNELRDRFGEAREWSATLRAVSHVRIVMREVRHRVLGTNQVPREVWIDRAEDAATLVGKRKEFEAFRSMVEQTRRRETTLIPWLARKPLKGLEHRDHWETLLDVVEWLKEHPRPGIFVRQMDVPRAHTKFVEQHKGVLSELFDIALPPEQIDVAARGAKGFERRYGFKARPERIRFRMLDPESRILPLEAGTGGPDIAVDGETFVRLNPPIERVLIVENEINFLSLPQMGRTMAIFGAGYGFETLGRARWISGCSLHYWGDIDTHGFAILDELRHHFRHTESFLMDRDTFLAFKALWTLERSPANRDLERLTPEELALYNDLRDNKLGTRLRLEQERIGFGWIEDRLRDLEASVSSILTF